MARKPHDARPATVPGGGRRGTLGESVRTIACERSGSRSRARPAPAF